MTPGCLAREMQELPVPAPAPVQLAVRRAPGPPGCVSRRGPDSRVPEHARSRVGASLVTIPGRPTPCAGQPQDPRSSRLPFMPTERVRRPEGNSSIYEHGPSRPGGNTRVPIRSAPCPPRLGIWSARYTFACGRQCNRGGNTVGCGQDTGAASGSGVGKGLLSASMERTGMTVPVSVDRMKPDAAPRPLLVAGGGHCATRRRSRPGRPDSREGRRYSTGAGTGRTGRRGSRNPASSGCRGPAPPASAGQFPACAG